MEEVADFEGFTPEDCLISEKCIRIYKEQTQKENSVDPNFSIIKKRRQRRCSPNKLPSSTPLCRRTNRTALLRFWQVREQFTFDTPHTVHDHAKWFENVLADLCNDNDKLSLTYDQYSKLVNLESSVNATMFITNCREISNECLSEQLAQQTTGRASKWKLKSTLMSSPLFSFRQVHEGWKRLGITCHGCREERNHRIVLPFIHWLGVLDQRKAWAGIGSQKESAELRMETLKALILKHGDLTVEDMAKIICSSFLVPPCTQLTELVYLTLKISSKIFHKSQDQEEGVTHSRHLQSVGPRSSETKRVPKPSERYKSAVSTEALYKGLMCDDASESSCDLQTDSVGPDSKSECTSDSYHERKEIVAPACKGSDQSQPGTSDVVWTSSCEPKRSFDIYSPRKFGTEQYEHTSLESHHNPSRLDTNDYISKVQLNRDKSSPSIKKEQSPDGCNESLQCAPHQDTVTLPDTKSKTCEAFVFGKNKVNACKENQSIDVKDMEDSVTSNCAESEREDAYGNNSDTDSVDSELLSQWMGGMRGYSPESTGEHSTDTAPQNPNRALPSPVLLRWDRNDEANISNISDVLKNDTCLSDTKLYENDGNSRQNSVPLDASESKHHTKMLRMFRKTEWSFLCEEEVKPSPLNSQGMTIKSSRAATSSHPLQHMTAQDRTDIPFTINPPNNQEDEITKPINCSKSQVSPKRTKENTKANNYPVLHPCVDELPEKSSVKMERDASGAQDTHSVGDPACEHSYAQKQLNKSVKQDKYSYAQKEITLVKQFEKSPAQKTININIKSQKPINVSTGQSCHELCNAQELVKRSDSSKVGFACTTVKRSDNREGRPKIVIKITSKKNYPGHGVVKQRDTAKKLYAVHGVVKQSDAAKKLSPGHGVVKQSDAAKKLSPGHGVVKQRDAAKKLYAVHGVVKQSDAAKKLSPGHGVVKQSDAAKKLYAVHGAVKQSDAAKKLYAVHGVVKQSDAAKKLSPGHGVVKQRDAHDPFKAQGSEGLGKAQQHGVPATHNKAKALQVTQDCKTTEVSNHLLPSTSSMKRETSPGHDSTPKRQRWKPFKLRDDAEENLRKRQRWKPFKLRDDAEEDYRKVVQKTTRLRRQSFDKKTLEKLKEPLLQGWVRELVQRLVCVSGSKDVYYHPPQGKKLRSSVEIEKYLHKESITDLKPENFTFWRDTLGFGEPLEVVRMAALKGASGEVVRMAAIKGSAGQSSSQDHRLRKGQDHSTSRKDRGRSLPGSASSPNTSKVESGTNSSVLPSDRFWVTRFEDVHNRMETDTTEIVNENGVMTGFEEWPPDGEMIQTDIPTSGDSILTSNNLTTATNCAISTTTVVKSTSTSSTATTATKTTTPDTAIRLNAVTTASTPTTPNAATTRNYAITATTATTRNNAITATTATTRNNAITATTATTRNNAITATTATTRNNAITATTATTRNNAITATTANINSSTKRTFITLKKFIARAIARTAASPIKISSTGETATQTCTAYAPCTTSMTGKTTTLAETTKLSRITPSYSGATASPTLTTTQHCITTPVMTSSRDTNTTLPTINPAPSNITISPADIATTRDCSTSIPMCSINAIGSRTNMQESIASTPTTLITTFATSTTSTVSPVNTTLIPPNTSQTCFTSSTKEKTSDILGSHATVTSTTTKLNPPNNNTYVFQAKSPSIQAVTSSLSQTTKNLDNSTQQSFKPKILNIYSPDDARRLFDSLGSPHPDSEGSDRNVCTPTSHPSEDMATGGVAALNNEQINIENDNSQEAHAQTKQDFTFIIPSSKINKTHLRKIRVTNNDLINSDTARHQQESSIRLPTMPPLSSQIDKTLIKKIRVRNQDLFYSDTARHQQESSLRMPVMPPPNFNSKQLLDPVAGTGQQPAPGSSSWHQPVPFNDEKDQPLSENRIGQEPTKTNSNAQQSLNINIGKEQSISVNSNMQMLAPVNSNRQQQVPIHTRQVNINSQQQALDGRHSPSMAGCIVSKKGNKLYPFSGNKQKLVSHSSNRHQLSPVTSSSQQPICNNNNQHLVLISNKQKPQSDGINKEWSVVTSNMQQSTALSNRQQAMAVNSNQQQPTPVSSTVQQSAPVLNCNQLSTRTISNQQTFTPVNSHAQQSASGWKQSRIKVYCNPKHTSVTSSGQELTPVLSWIHTEQPPTANSSRQQPSTVTSSRQQPLTVTSSRQQSSTVTSSRRPSTVTSSIQQPSTITSSMQQSTPVVNYNQQSIPVMNLPCYSQQSTQTISSGQQSIPAVNQQSPLLFQGSHQSTTAMSFNQQSAPLEGSRQLPIPVMRYNQQSTLAVSSMQELVPVTDNSQFSLVMNEHHSLTAMSNRQQQSSPLGQASQCLASSQQTIPVMSDDQKMIPGGSNVQMIPGGSNVQMIPGGSNVQMIPGGSNVQMIPGGSNVQQMISGGSYVQQIIPGGSYVQQVIPGGSYVQQMMIPGGSYVQQVIPDGSNFQQMIPGGSNFQQMIPGGSNFQQMIPGGSNFQQMIPGGSNFRQIMPNMSNVHGITSDTHKIIPIVNNNALNFASNPTNLSEATPIITGLQSSLTTTTASQYNTSMLEAPVISPTPITHHKESSSIPHGIITHLAVPHTITEQPYLGHKLVLSQKISEDNRPPVITTITDEVASVSSLKDTTCNANINNHTKDNFRQKKQKQTARKSTSSRFPKTKPTSSRDMLFVDVGILNDETEDSSVEKTKSVSEKEEKQIVAMDITLEDMSMETIDVINKHLQQRFVNGRLVEPSTIDAPRRIGTIDAAMRRLYNRQESTNPGNSTVNKSPPPLKHLYPTTPNKVTRDTCPPPLTPISQMGKLSPRTKNTVSSHPQQKTTSTVSSGSSISFPHS